MTKILNFALKIKGRVAHAKSSDPATPSPKKKLKRAQNRTCTRNLLLNFIQTIRITNDILKKLTDLLGMKKLKHSDQK